MTMLIAQADAEPDPSDEPEAGAEPPAEAGDEGAHGDAPAATGDAPAATGEPEEEGLIEEVEHELADDHHGEEPFLSAELILVVVLLCVVALVWKPAKRSILGALDSRAEKIRGELDEAYRLKEDAQATLAAYQRKQRDAMEEAERIVEHARQEADRLRETAIRSLEQQLERREAQAMERIAQAERAVAAELRNAAVDAAVAAAHEVIAGKLDAAASARLIDQSISELPRKLV